MATITPKVVTSNSPMRNNVGYMTQCYSPSEGVLMRFPTGVSLWAAALVVSSCGGGEPSPASSVAQQQTAWAVKLEPLTLPVSGTTSQPQLTLSERGLILSWMQQQDASFALMFAERSSAAWSPSRTVATSTEWFVSEADVPTVMRMSDG